MFYVTGGATAETTTDVSGNTTTETLVRTADAFAGDGGGYDDNFLYQISAGACKFIFTYF